MAEPAVQERPAAQGRLHLQPGEEHGRRGRLEGLTWNYAAHVRPELRARRLRPSARVPDRLRVGTAVHEGRHERGRAPLRGWQLNGIWERSPARPTRITGTNDAGVPGVRVDFIDDTGTAGRPDRWAIHRAVHDDIQVLAAAGRQVDGFGRRARTPSAGRRAGTSTSRCSRRSLSATSAPSSGWNSRTSSTTPNWGAPNTTYTAPQLHVVRAGQCVGRSLLGHVKQHAGAASHSAGLPVPVLELTSQSSRAGR